MQSTIFTLESKVTFLETLVRTPQAQEQIRSWSLVIVQASIHPTPSESDIPAASSIPAPSSPSPPSSSPPTSPSQPDSLTQKLTEWKKSVKGQWSFVPEELATERERLASAQEEWKSKLRLTWVLRLRSSMLGWPVWWCCSVSSSNGVWG